MSTSLFINLNDRVETALTALISDGEPFTLLDVSNKVKQDGNGFVRHREVRPIASQLISDEEIEGSEDYTSTLITVSTNRGSESARLYHEIDYDPEDYTDRQQHALTPREIDNINANVSSVVDDDDDDDDDNSSPIFQTTGSPLQRSNVFKTPHPRADGAVEIPRAVLEEAGILGECVTITNHPNSIGINVCSGSCKGRRARAGMRISKTCLQKSNMAGVGQLEAAAFKDKVVLARPN